jgi:hypothetical protein
MNKFRSLRLPVVVAALCIAVVVLAAARPVFAERAVNLNLAAASPERQAPAPDISNAGIVLAPCGLTVPVNMREYDGSGWTYWYMKWQIDATCSSATVTGTASQSGPVVFTVTGSVNSTVIGHSIYGLHLTAKNTDPLGCEDGYVDRIVLDGIGNEHQVGHGKSLCYGQWFYYNWRGTLSKGP